MIIRRCDHRGCKTETYEDPHGHARCARHRVIPEAAQRAELVIVSMIAGIMVTAAILLAQAMHA